ncbi:hypothetical protein [Kibdelosporangium philippinense]|uniref:hypothetical protein n=1 Tax=Kibdelosporangium philippinense TaxID=211113 RepID=UPI003617DC45
MEDPTVKFATPRLASGALFVNRDRIFWSTRLTATDGTSLAAMSIAANLQRQPANVR